MPVPSTTPHQSVVSSARRPAVTSPTQAPPSHRDPAPTDATSQGADTAPADNPALVAARTRIAEIDRTQLDLLAERRAMSRRIAEHKLATGTAVRNTRVEREGLAALIRRGRELDLEAPFITRLFQTVIEDSVQLQTATLHAARNAEAGRSEHRVAVLGGPGSYSHQAAEKYVARRGGTLAPVPGRSFADVAGAVGDGAADYALLPIENTTSGSINEVYDLLYDTDLHIIGEITHRIDHALLAKDAGLTPEAISVLYVHPQVYAQCSHFLARLGDARIVYCDSTADAMGRVVQGDDPRAAAIGSGNSGALFDLHAIVSDLANQKQNHTRFIVVGPTPTQVPGQVDAKTSVIFVTGQEAGALVNALAAMRDNRINMVKLESRPIPGKPWAERFYLDVAGNLNDPRLDRALDQMRGHTRRMKVLGCYPADSVQPVDMTLAAALDTDAAD
nr:prephenate dehydratase domain-containing protein [Rhodothalassium salexigens]